MDSRVCQLQNSPLKVSLLNESSKLCVKVGGGGGGIQATEVESNELHLLALL